LQITLYVVSQYAYFTSQTAMRYRLFQALHYMVEVEIYNIYKITSTQLHSRKWNSWVDLKEHDNFPQDHAP
jgi:hypothetical protein